MRNGKKRILVLYWHPDPHELRVGIHRHLHVMDWSRHHHEVVYYNAIFGAPKWLRQCRFDALVLHTTLLCLRWSHLFAEWKWKLRWIAEMDSTKLAIPQDEYDHAWVLDEWLYELGVSVIFSNFEEQHHKVLYPIMHTKASYHKCLTGYLDDGDAARMRDRLQPHQERPRDLVYRASHLPYWFGSQGQLKHEVADVVAKEAGRQGVRHDISTAVEDTIVGQRWMDFLASGRAVIGCESGSSVLDRRGEVRAKVQMLCGTRPYLSFDEVRHEMPSGWDDYRFFAISPRHFEAILTKTCQILVEGYYDGILEPGRHYLPLKRDFSNLDDVFAQLRDRRTIEQTAETAYREVYEQRRLTYRGFAEQIDHAIEKQQTSRRVGFSVSKPTPSFLSWTILRTRAKLSERVRLLYYRLTRQVVQSSAHWWILRHPVVCIAKLLVSIKLIWGNVLTRTMLAHYLSTGKLRNQIRLHRIVSDLLTFRLLQVAQEGGASADLDMHVEARFDPASAVLVFFTRPGLRTTQERPERGGDPLGMIDRPRSVVWDHSAVGRQILYPFVASKRLAFQVGTYGTYTFETLAAVIRSLPDSQWERLCRTIRNGCLSR